jgi:tRNA A37 threonylcarbamoyladenosine synthetase subunit TsaC/SUA5/YrdC
MGIVLKELGEIPLYSTSLNFSSEPVVSSSEDLERWRVDSRLKSNNVYIPTISFDGLSSEASTLVEIDLETQSFVIIRKGAHYEFVREKLGSCKWFSAKARNP